MNTDGNRMQDHLIKQEGEFKEKQQKRSESYKGGTKNGLKQHIKEQNAKRKAK